MTGAYRYITEKANKKWLAKDFLRGAADGEDGWVAGARNFTGRKPKPQMRKINYSSGLSPLGASPLSRFLLLFRLSTFEPDHQDSNVRR